MTAADLAHRCGRARAHAGQWMGQCPAHDDQTASLSIADGEKGVVVHCFAGCETGAILGALGLTFADLMASTARDNGAMGIIATYDYCDAHGTLRYQVVRRAPKTFYQRVPDPTHPGEWKTRDAMRGITRILYRLPEVLQASTVYIVEGEKDADRLHALGLCATTNVGGAGKGKWLPSYTDTLRGKTVILLPDNDLPGQEHMRYVAAALQGVATSVSTVQLPVPPKGDVSDWLQVPGHDRAALEALVAQDAWRTALMVDAKGRPKETIANMDILLAHLPVMDAVWWNAFHQEVMWDARPFTPEDLHTIAAALARTYGLALTRRTLLQDAITTYAKTHRTRDPLLTYVQGLTWDGIPRLAYWLVNYLGAAPTPANSAIGTALCCAMVARALQPGCIQRLVVILEGPENIGKSEVCKILGAPWSDTLFRHMDTRDAQLLLHGCWLMEIPELDAYRKTEDSAIKAFISNTMDTYIPKYSNLRARIPRRTVFVGTVNPTGPYLKGQTGNTRFLPVACTTIDLPGLRLVRDKLLAEARTMVERGDHWWEAVEQMEEIDTLREARRDSSVFEPLITEWLTQTGRHDHAEYVTMEEVLRKALGIQEPERWKDKSLTTQVGMAMHQCGWVRARVQAEGLRQWVYRKS